MNLELPALTVKSEIVELKTKRIMLIHFVGSISNNNSMQASRAVPQVFESEVYDVILGMEKLEYINSVGVALLLSLVKTVDQKKGRLVIGGVHTFLENILKLMDIPKKVPIYQTLEEAKASFS